MITSSSFRALQGQRVRSYLSILRSLFSPFQGLFVVRLLTFFPFVALLLILASVALWRSTVDSRSVTLAHVVMSSTTGALEPNVVIANEVQDAAEDDTDHGEFDLDELKEQFGIDGILEKLSDLAAKFCSEKSRTEYFGSEAQNSKSSSETVEGVFDPSAAVVSHKVSSTNEPHEEEFKLPFGVQGNRKFWA